TAEGPPNDGHHRLQSSRSLLVAVVVSVLALPLVLVDLVPDGGGSSDQETAIVAPAAAYTSVPGTARQTTSTAAPTTTVAPTTTAAPTTTTAAPTTTAA